MGENPDRAEAPRRLPSLRRTGPANNRPGFVVAIWRTLTQPWLLLATGGLALLMIVAGLVLPQLPGQLNDEPATAARWLLMTSESYGASGDFLRNLGLFNVLRSPLLRVLLAVIGLVLGVQLADLVGGLIFARQLTAYAQTTANGQCIAIPLPAYQDIVRRRYVVKASRAEVKSSLAEWIVREFDDFREFSLSELRRLEEHEGNEPTSHSTEFDAASGARGIQTNQETRLLGLRSLNASWLRPLLMAGLLIALIALWLIVMLGWQVTTPALAPGDAYRSASHQLDIRYMMPDLAGSDTGTPYADVKPTVEVRLPTSSVTRTVESDERLRLNRLRVSISEAAPALVVTTPSTATDLVRPGEDQSSSAIGLVFPTPGSEESILVPDRLVGLRIIRSAGSPPEFVVEVYRGSDLPPVQRIEVETAGNFVVLDGDDPLVMTFLPAPGLRFEIRHTPGAWLLWIALVLVIAGVAGYWRQPAFVLVQLCDWPQNATLIIAQANGDDDLQALVRHSTQTENSSGTGSA